MEITDIPSQIARAFKYSLRSKTSFLLSLLAAGLVLGVSFDLLYGFGYRRVFNTKDAHYGPTFWSSLLFVALVLPVASGLYSILRARAQTRPFQPGRYGIAIAPFEVFSLDPDTLGTSSKLQALDTVMNQFFTAANGIINQENWAQSFEFRFLPPNIRIHNTQEAVAQRTSLGATLIIWGEVIQQSYSPLRIVFHLLGTELDLTMQGPLDPFTPIPFLKFCALSAAAFSHRANGEHQRARELFLLARSPASELDKQANTNTNVAIIDGCVSKLDDAMKKDVAT
ncbi:MAG: hypothetical protein HY677_01820 [Chloroflexi bacterium]|nr:hypothetical protein [Chloroflexota bacterium]